MTPAQRVVFDCNVLFQALISPEGPSGAVVAAAKSRQVSLIVSPWLFDELVDVATRPRLASRFAISERRLNDFVESLRSRCTVIAEVPHVYDHPRDPDDAHYVDLAVAADAKLIVSRDNDLLALADHATVEGRDFAARFPDLSILTPPELLALLAEPAGE
jgi:putative PIN family toxin of toxin-antitoxin system